MLEMPTAWLEIDLNESVVETMELTQIQNDYIQSLVEDWNRLVGDKSPKDFVKDELGLAIVTSTAAMVAEMISKQSDDPDTAKIWGFVILGAFLHSEGLMHVGGDTLQ
jgi:hypothetical protein